jgi:hypothetical protein
MLSVELVELVYFKLLWTLLSKAGLLKKEKFFSPETMLVFLFASLARGFEDYLTYLPLLFLGMKLNVLKIKSCWFLGEMTISSLNNLGCAYDRRSSCEEYLEIRLDLARFY